MEPGCYPSERPGCHKRTAYRKANTGLGHASWGALRRLSTGQLWQGTGPGQGLELGAGLGHATCMGMGSLSAHIGDFAVSC